MLPVILVAVGAYLIGDSVLGDSKKYAKGGKVDYSKQTSDDFKLGEIVWDTDNKRYGTIIGIYDGYLSDKFEVRLDTDGMQPTENLRKVGSQGDEGTKQQLKEEIDGYARLVKSYPKNNYPTQRNQFVGQYAKGGDVRFYEGQSVIYPSFIDKKMDKSVRDVHNKFANKELVIDKITIDKPFNTAKVLDRNSGEKAPFDLILDPKYVEQYAKGGKLVGKQKNLDVNKNGKLDAEDFKMLRGKKMAKGGEVADIAKVKKSLISKAKSKGLYENFGVKERRQLEDKYGNTPEIRDFDNWLSNFDLSQL